MTDVRIVILIFNTMYAVHPGRRRVSAQTPTKPPVYQPDKELSVKIEDSATLRCCVFDHEFGMMAWFKQTDRKPPQVIIRFFSSSEEIFYHGIQKSRVQIVRASNCFNMTIWNITPSDEAMYYCAMLMTHKPVFGDGTYLKIQETSKPAVCNNSVVCESTPRGNNTNINTQETTVLGLGTALGLCALLIFCLTYFLLRRRKREEIKTCVEDSPETGQESEALNYAALQFSKKKAKADKREAGLFEECVYSRVR